MIPCTVETQHIKLKTLELPLMKNHVKRLQAKRRLAQFLLDTLKFPEKKDKALR